MIELYKKDNTGKIRVWGVEAMDQGMIIKHGYQGGSMIGKYVEVMTNQSGRSIDEQIQLEIDSRISKKMDEGYTVNLNEVGTKFKTNSLDLPLPMLAQPLDKIKQAPSAYLSQFKYDGMRCLVHHGESGLIAYSRRSKRIETIRHILERIDIPKGTTLDGELYIHGAPLQSIMSFAKRFQRSTLELQYIVYDVVMDEPYTKRYNALNKMIPANTPHVKVAPTRMFDELADINKSLGEARALGYEGLILRDAKTPYEAGKRSKSLIKVKTVEDDEFTIHDITPSSDGHAILHCDNFSVLAPGTHEFKSYVLENSDKYIGTKVRVEYANKTKDGVPFHPVATNLIE